MYLITGVAPNGEIANFQTECQQEAADLSKNLKRRGWVASVDYHQTPSLSHPQAGPLPLPPADPDAILADVVAAWSRLAATFDAARVYLDSSAFTRHSSEEVPTW